VEEAAEPVMAGDPDVSAGAWVGKRSQWRGLAEGSYRGRTTVLSGTSGTASAINDRGEITGYFVVGVGASFVWRAGQLTEIPLLPDRPEASLMQAQGINNRGQVVGNDSFVWESNTATLSKLPGLTATEDINDRGQIVGFAGSTPDNLGPHAVLLTPENH
jgi:hypothetical protein